MSRLAWGGTLVAHVARLERSGRRGLPGRPALTLFWASAFQAGSVFNREDYAS